MESQLFLLDFFFLLVSVCDSTWEKRQRNDGEKEAQGTIYLQRETDSGTRKKKIKLQLLEK